MTRLYHLSKSFCIAPGHGGKLTVFVRDSGARLQLHPWFSRVLLDLGETGTFSDEEFVAALRRHAPEGESPIEHARLLGELIDVGVLWTDERWGLFEAANAGVHLEWEDHGWASAKLFHDSIVYSRFLQGDAEGWDEQVRAMEEIRDEGEGPPVVKRYPPEFERIALGAPHDPLTRNFGEVLHGRRTCRVFDGERPVTRASLASVLFHAAKAQESTHNRFFGPHIKRTSPSGGSRHPVEIYPQVFDSPDGLDGSFYYDFVEHCLVRLGDADRGLMYELCQKQAALERNFVVFLVSVRFVRHYWKYRYPKSYLFALFDVGHLVQTLILVCEALGLRCFLTPALDVAGAQRHLGLDNIYDECPVYFLAAGHSPPERR
ncbi:MAG: SagB/ThcOx family dehydrogenase [Gammaproteobacteria bacterium]